MIMALATLLFFLGLLALLYVRAHTLLAYFQQEEYDGARFLAAVVRMRLYDLISTVAVLALVILGAIVGRLDLALVLCAIVFVAVANRERKFRFKKPLVMTARAKRLGLSADADFETVIREYVRENPAAVKLPVTA